LEEYDIIMLVVLVGATLLGAIKGFAWQLASITSIVLSYLVAYHFREPLSQSIHADPPWNRFLAMLILYLGTSLVIWVAFRMISQTIDRFRLKEFDRQVGAMFGFAKGTLYCVLITLFAVTLLGETIRQAVVKSKSGRYIAQILDRSESVIPEEIQEVVGPYLKRFDQRLQEVQQLQNGSDGGLSPWINKVTESAVPTSIWPDQTSRTTGSNDSVPASWMGSANQLPSSYSAPSFPQQSSSQNSSNPPPVQQAERPWSSVYSRGVNR
jgi:membrane protein required for colicin V production